MSIPAALAGGKYFLYMCSGASTSGQLSDKSLYSYFFRTIADDPSQGIVIAQYLQYMGWKSAALVTSNDAYGQSVSGTFLTTAQTLGITVKANQAFNPGQTDYTFLIDAILASGSHIIVLASSASTSLPFMRAANARGLIGPQWAYDTWGTLGNTKAHQDLANGMIYVYPQAKTFNAAFNASLARYTQAYPNGGTSNYGFMFLGMCFPSLFPLMYCLTAIARGVIRLAQDVSPADILSRNYRPNMTRYFLEPFDGVTGRVEYDRNGNRIASSLVYDVLANKTVVPRGPVRFNDGTSNVPRDSTFQEPLVPYWSSPSGIALTVLNVIILAVIAVAWTLLFVKREQPTVRSLILFSNISALGDPTNVGCQASLWLFTYGFELVMASSAAKAYRLWRIFDNRYISAGKIGNKYLFAVGAQMAILVSRRTYYFYRCTSPDANFNMILSGTRNIAANFNETSFLFYTAQNTFLSGAVVAAFAFFDFGESHLSGSLSSKSSLWFASLPLYSVAFAFAALVGRIALAALLAPSTPGSQSKAPLNSNAAKAGMQTFPRPVANPLQTTSFTQETLACKKLGSLMSTWINHNVLQYDVSESFQNCIEVWAKGKGWAIQFESAEKMETWLNLLGSSNATRKTPTSSSTGAATSMQRKSTTSGA
ncbi:periplasmic binding protein-like I [Catenaria anguillulae PL171]|uniref:Periplasmic binding protein-like I n=1 Tax=Catenaria anguillulae PL171 TaxID=765915 RepID=A0A1Y2HJ41_9FUNG|nr:periplasmic binding protein-like I [Catenaria anguillulae PL171]